MAMDEITKMMFAGDQSAIIDGFISSSTFDNVNAIIQATLHNIRTKPVETQLQRLRFDDTCLFGTNAGYRVSHFAEAAIHLLGFSQYKGNEKRVIDLIESGFSFYS